MKNKIDDLRNHLFAQLERLGEESLSGEKLADEIERAKAVRSVSDAIINSAKEETHRIRAINDTGIRSGTVLMEAAENDQRRLLAGSTNGAGNVERGSR